MMIIHSTKFVMPGRIYSPCCLCIYFCTIFIDPPAITGIEVTEVCTNDFTVSWTPANYEEGLSYNVTLLSPSMMNDRVADAVMDTFYNFTDLIPNTAYNVSVASRPSSTCVGIATTTMVTTLTVEAGVPYSELIVMYSLVLCHLISKLKVILKFTQLC